MSKESRKRRRKVQLCTNKRFVFDRFVSREEREEINEWCEENLSCAYCWFDSPELFWESKSEVGFHDQYDLVAFILRWA